jgi:hypothetical protein
MASRPRPAFGHEAFEFVAVLGATDRIHILGELALRVVQLAALFIEARELRRPPVVEGGVASRSGIKTTRPPRCAAARPTGIRAHHRACILPLVGRKRLQIGPAVAALPELVTEDRQTDRPEDDEAENHGDDLKRTPP